MGNISKIFEGEDNQGQPALKVEYFYDEYNQLKRQNNAYTGKTIEYTYDFGGNIQRTPQRSKKTVNYGFCSISLKTALNCCLTL